MDALLTIQTLNVLFGSRLNVNHDFSQLNSISVVIGGFVVISKFHLAVQIQMANSAPVSANACCWNVRKGDYFLA